jgi:hypothetical protein
MAHLDKIEGWDVAVRCGSRQGRNMPRPRDIRFGSAMRRILAHAPKNLKKIYT